MVADAPHILPDASLPNYAQDPDRQRAWFALALPAVMALLVTLVPLIGKAAFGPIVLTLVPLVLWAAFRDTERALYVYIAWCWMDGTIRGLVDQNVVAIVARDLILGSVVVGWGLQRLQTRHQNPLRCPPGTLLIALFVINCLLQIFNPYSLGLVQSIGGLKLHLSTVPLVFLAYDTLRRREQVRAFFLFLTLATLVIGLVSLVQYVQGQDWTWAHFPGTKQVISQTMRSATQSVQISEIASFKPPGTTGFGGGTAAFLGLLFPLPFALVMLAGSQRFSKFWRIAFLGIMLAFIVIIFINSLRSALVMAVVGIILVGVLIGGRLRARVLLAMAACFVLGLAAMTYSANLSQGGVTDRFASTFANPVDALHQDRSTFFDQAGFILVHSPLGVGLGRTGAAAGRLGSDAQDTLGFSTFSEAYLGNIMFETGILGGILITCIMLFFLVRGYQSSVQLQSADDKFLLTALVAVLGVIFANFFVSPILVSLPGSVIFWVFGGMILRVFPVSGARLIKAKVAA